MKSEWSSVSAMASGGSFEASGHSATLIRELHTSLPKESRRDTRTPMRSLVGGSPSLADRASAAAPAPSGSSSPLSVFEPDESDLAEATGGLDEAWMASGCLRMTSCVAGPGSTLTVSEVALASGSACSSPSGFTTRPVAVRRLSVLASSKRRLSKAATPNVAVALKLPYSEPPLRLGSGSSESSMRAVAFSCVTLLPEASKRRT